MAPVLSHIPITRLDPSDPELLEELLGVVGEVASKGAFTMGTELEAFEAEDVTQHVFTKLLTALPKYEQRNVPFAAWILRVARNVAVDHMRLRRAIPCEEVRELEPGVNVTDEQSLTLREALATLPEDQRQVIVLRHLVGLSPGEIADELGKTEPSIHGLHHRGRRALQAELTSRESMPSTVLLGAAA